MSRVARAWERLRALVGLAPPPSPPPPEPPQEYYEGPWPPRGTTPNPLQPGDQLEGGKYRIEALLGAGRVGVVYRARESEADRLVTIKVVHTSMKGFRHVAKRSARSFRATLKVPHPSLVESLAAGALDDGTPYLVREHLVGRSLETVLRDEGRLRDVPAALRLLASLAHGLQCAHDQGILHRNLCPKKVFVEDGPPRRLKLLDPGLDSALDANVRIGMVILTDENLHVAPEYASPERVSGKKSSEACDLYSFGLVLYAALSGQLPFDFEKRVDLLRHHLDARPIALTQRTGEPVAAALQRLLDRLLAKAPGDRPASAREVGEELERIAASLEQDTGRA